MSKVNVKRIIIIAVALLPLLASIASSQSQSLVNQQRDLDSLLIAPTDWESLKTIETDQDDCDFENVSDSCSSAFPKPLTTAEARSFIVADQCNTAAKVLAAYRPCYPPLAMRARVSGLVSVLVVVDEAGFVTWAHAWKGHPLLNAAVVKAVCKWRFEPAHCSDGIQTVNRMISFVFVEAR